MHLKEEQEELAYYKARASVIEQYNKVLLFGPSEAKNELFNLLKADHHFDKVDIEIKQADKMNKNQQHVFVKEYFFKRLSSVE